MTQDCRLAIGRAPAKVLLGMLGPQPKGGIHERQLCGELAIERFARGRSRCAERHGRHVIKEVIVARKRGLAERREENVRLGADFLDAPGGRLALRRLARACAHLE